MIIIIILSAATGNMFISLECVISSETEQIYWAFIGQQSMDWCIYPKR